MKRTVKTEVEMIELGEEIAKVFSGVKVFELVGDVGAGKTTLTKGFAKYLGIEDEITSPSFTISKQYAAESGKKLVHYDFYRLSEPGLMMDDLAENLNDEEKIIILEWAESIKEILPKNHKTIKISLNEDGSRNVEIEE